MSLTKFKHKNYYIFFSAQSRNNQKVIWPQLNGTNSYTTVHKQKKQFKVARYQIQTFVILDSNGIQNKKNSNRGSILIEIDCNQVTIILLFLFPSFFLIPFL